jgi:PAS domain S-box-containing protein
MKDEIRVLIVEDSPDDAVFVINELEKGGIRLQHRRVDTARDMKSALTVEQWDIILLDYSIPGFGAMPALALLKEMQIDLPVIIISGVIGEDTAVAAMRAGAHDFIVKGKYARLVPAVKREIEEYIQLKAREAEAKKHKAEAVKQRQLAFTMIMQNPQPLLIIDTKFNIKLANEAFLSMSGYSEEQLQKMNIREFKILKKSGHNLKEAIATKKGVTGQVTVQFPKATHSLEQHTVPLLDKDGELVSIMAVYNDLTEKLAEEAKREELANYITAYLSSMADNLTKLSKGNLDFNLEIAPSSKTTAEAQQWFTGINKNLAEVKKALNLLITDADILSKAAIEGKLDTRADAGRHLGDYQKVVRGVNECLDAVIGPLNVAAEYVDRISKGDIPAKITDKYNGDFNAIKNNLNNCIDNINALTADAGVLVKAAVEGKLDTRADASKHQGDYQKIVEGVNKTLDAVIGPLNVAAEYVDRISKGDIPAKITDKYNGDFNEIKNNLNNCIDNINALTADAGLLAKAAVEGKLATRADASRHMGDYQKIVVGVNNCLDSVIGPLNVAADYVDKISKGAIPAKITDPYNGDFNVIKNNLNNCIDAVNALVADAGMLRTAAVEGKLATRADVTRHMGDYQKIVKGVNDCLDSVIGPLNVAADYVDKISKGAIPAKITDKYNGDFNVIKNNLNNCIDAVNALVADAGLLAKAAVEGKLATRADASKHMGDYQKIVVGVNNCLDSVIGPLNVAADYVDKISKGAIPAKITDKYNGDFNVIKNNLNNCIDNINALVADAGMLRTAAVEGKLDTRADASRHMGDYQKIVKGVNDCLDAVIGPLNVAAEYVDRISKGDIPPKITDKYNGDFNEIKNNLNNCIDNINALTADAGLLAKAAVEGKLDTRADASRHMGDYQKIVKGVNDCLDSVIGPLNVAAEYVDRISKGDIPAKITDKYNGDFNEIKNNLNNCIDNINALTADAGLLAKAAVEGKLDTRANASRHMGDYQKIVKGVNDCLDSVIGPLNVAAEYVDRISKGDIPAKITDKYNGDFNEIKNNLNNCIDNINALTADAGLLAKAAVEGKLDTRADASRHMGDYQKIVKGVNDCLDSVIGPLNVAAEYVDRISKGDIPAKITDKYNGDFNEIKNNLNNCIDNINALTADAKMLAKAAVEGKLATRADATRHMGDYKKIVEGVNATLDSVIAPVNEALRISLEYAHCNFAARVDEKLSVAGDFQQFKDALNNIGIEVSKAVILINQQVDALGEAAKAAGGGVNDISAGATQIAKNTGQVNANAEKSNFGVEQVLKAMADLSAAVEEVASSMESVAGLAKNADTLSADGVKLAGKANQSMMRINDSTKIVDTNIIEINSKMKEIGKIVKLIRDIANQTNLLALNAAIEAARAGDAGRGFAVVAAEVKSLAQESRGSAENIAAMIEDLQKRSQKSAEAVVQASQQVTQGSRDVEDTLTVFNKIVESVAKISQSSTEVATATEQQSASVEEITASVHEVSGLIKGTAKEAGDAAAATEEASAALDEITKVVEKVNTIAKSVGTEMTKFRV